MTKYILLLVLSLIYWNAHSQEVKHLDSERPEAFNENVTVKKLDTSPDQTSFLIWVSDTVRPHFHKNHTESIYVLEGSGKLYLNGTIHELTKGDFVQIPKGAVHSFKNLSETRTKVLSIQTPEFLGKDRIWVD